MLRDQKNRIYPVYLIIFLLIINLLSGCSGCSKSGIVSKKNANRSSLADSIYDNRSNQKTSESDTIFNPAYEE